MCLNCHPAVALKFLAGDKNQNDDGLSHRMTMLAPRPPNITSKHRGGETTTNITMVIICLTLELMHVEPKNYTLDDQAKSYIHDTLDYYQNMALIFNQYDPFVALVKYIFIYFKIILKNTLIIEL